MIKGAEDNLTAFVGGVYINKSILKNTIQLIVFILVVSMLGTKAKGIESNTRFKRVEIEKGLSQASAQVIFQDSKGYIWIGTSDGANRYDGQQYKTYKYELDDSNSLTSNNVDDIVQDDDGAIWFATSKGLNRLDSNTEKIKRYTSNSSDSKSLSDSNVWALLKSRDGKLWVGTTAGLDLYDKNTDSFNRYNNNPSDDNSLSNDFITCLFEDLDGIIWIGTKNGLNCYNPKTKKFTRYYSNQSNDADQDSNFITKICEDSSGNIWAGTNSSGIRKYNKYKGTYTEYKNSEEKNSIPSNSIQALFRDSLGNMWVGTKSGLSKYDSVTNKFANFQNKYYDSTSLVNDDVVSIYQDKSGLIWIGTNKGISTFQPHINFKNYTKNPAEGNGLSDEMVGGIYEDEDNILWVGTNSGKLNRINRDTGEVKYYSSQLISKINSLTGDKQGHIWVSTVDGLYKFDKNTDQFKLYTKTSDENSLTDKNVKYTYIGRDGVLWICTRQGLDSFNQVTGKVTHYQDILKKSGVSDNFISYIFEDMDGILWIGCGLDGGLIKFDRNTNNIKIYKSKDTDNNSLTSNSIKAISEDKLGNLWIATNHGLNKFNKEKEQFERYTEKDGLVNNYVYGVLLDDYNNPWLSTNGGISKFDVNKGSFVSYDESDGLQGNEFNEYSFYRSKSGEMFFGGINGLSSFYPSEIIETGYVPQTIIQKLKVLNKEVELSDEIKLKYNENYFSFNFFLVDYKNTDKNEYAYMLEGVDKDWVYSSNRNSASYTNIDSGTYVFKVKGKNSSGVWSKPASIKIVVSKPPWKSGYAYMLYFLVFVVIVYFIWNYVSILENLVKQRTVELNNKLKENEVLYAKLIDNEKIKNNYFVNLSHELKTPLNVILSAVQLINNYDADQKRIGREKLKDYMNIIDRNSNRLLKVINDIIDSSKIEAGQYNIKIEEVEIVNLVEDTALSMKEYIESNGIELIIDPEVEEKKILCDPNEIERCVVNLLSNATKFTDKGGRITVLLNDLGNSVRISVKDTGIGISEENQRIIFQRFGQVDSKNVRNKMGSGIGLTLVKHLVDLHKGTVEVKSKLKQGSEFIITLPINPQEDI
jgi:ligand-binding sensor domain-containing protein/signal transduction histidine kinase